jgi:3-hydroxyisobutyrate dehydrogenase
MSIVFYDAAAKWQIRARGHADLHFENDLARQAWQASHPMCQRTYLSRLAPGVEIEEDLASTYPPGLEKRRPTPEESEAGYRNFAVLLCQVVELDSLHLQGTGHNRYLIQELEEQILRVAP